MLDFQTTAWRLTYYPGRIATNYRVIYAVIARLHRMEDSKLLWRGACTATSTQDPEKSPTMDELKANDGTLLKEHIEAVSDACARVLFAQFSERS